MLVGTALARVTLTADLPADRRGAVISTSRHYADEAWRAVVEVLAEGPLAPVAGRQTVGSGIRHEVATFARPTVGVAVDLTDRASAHSIDGPQIGRPRIVRTGIGGAGVGGRTEVRRWLSDDVAARGPPAFDPRESGARRRRAGAAVSGDPIALGPAAFGPIPAPPITTVGRPFTPVEVTVPSAPGGDARAVSVVPGAAAGRTAATSGAATGNRVAAGQWLLFAALSGALTHLHSGVPRAQVRQGETVRRRAVVVAASGGEESEGRDGRERSTANDHGSWVHPSPIECQMSSVTSENVRAFFRLANAGVNPRSGTVFWPRSTAKT